MAWKAAGLLAASFVLCAPAKTVLYEWGSGNYDPRKGFPEDVLNFKNFRPHLVRNFSAQGSPNLTALAYGESLAAGVDDRGDLYVWPKHRLTNVKIEGIDDGSREVRLLHRGGYTAVAFTKGILFALNREGQVWQWRFDLHADQPEDPPARHVKSLSNIVQISAGNDHFACVDGQGTVWTMGDDTFGQCGLESYNRQLNSPYIERRIPNPAKVHLLNKKAKTVKCGKEHTIVLMEDGTVYGWGRNHKQQLGSIDIKLGAAPAPVSYEPSKLMSAVPGRKVTKIAAGGMFSIFIVDADDEEEEVYGCGINSYGQLGLGFLSHTNDCTKIDPLSNLVIQTEKGLQKVKLSQVECGTNHCLALTDVGSVFTWGGNEEGEQGNRKRAFLDHPAVSTKFLKHRVTRVVADRTSSAVLVTKG